MQEIKVLINGKERLVKPGTTIQELLYLYQLKEKAVALELNREVLDRTRFETTALQENDKIEIVHFVGGG